MDVRYFTSSLTVDVAQFARAVRGHWSIENSCHWSLDLTFREDESRLRERQLRENVAWLNRFALSLLKQHPGRQSVTMKRRSCGWSDAFLTQSINESSFSCTLALASQPTRSRFENAVSIPDLWRLRDRLVDLFLQSFDMPPHHLTLDRDAFDDPAHGQQQLVLFHGDCEQDQYLPMIFTCGLPHEWRARG